MAERHAAQTFERRRQCNAGENIAFFKGIGAYACDRRRGHVRSFERFAVIESVFSDRRYRIGNGDLSQAALVEQIIRDRGYTLFKCNVSKA